MSAERAACNPCKFHLSAMQKQQPRCTDLDSRNTDTNMCGLDHANIVGTITDCQKNCLLVLFHEFYDESLLKRRNATQCIALVIYTVDADTIPTANDSFAHYGEFEKYL